MADDSQTPRRSPDYGGRLGYGIFHLILRVLGVRCAYVLLAFVVPYYVLFRPSARRSAKPYLIHRFPEASRFKRFCLTIRHFYMFGQILVDQAAMGILGPENFEVSFPDEDALYARAQEGRGMVLLTTHLGCWQAAMSNMKNLAVPVSFQFRLEEHTHGRHFFDLAEARGDFRIINPETFLGGMVEMTNALLAGECVSAMGDRAFGARTATVPFLGESAAFPVVPYHLVSRTGADLVALFAVRTGPCAYRIESVVLNGENQQETESKTTGKPPELLECYVAALEDTLQRHPFMWFNFFDFWAVSRGT